jgi:tetratricopeptide (TPR) repeat protein
MEIERWKKIEGLYQAVMAQPAEQRADILQRVCPGDPELRAEVASLLVAAGHASSFLEDSPVSGAAELFSTVNPPFDPETTSGPTQGGPGPAQATFPDEIAGSVIGRYRLLQKIGEGGMGEVWLAEQKEPVRRRVALKLIKAGMNSREVVARFESERQALALMDHPAIAKAFDAGSTPAGAPYFVMEYVAGVPITTYSDNHRLSTHERLDLFVRVCEGVQHAHQKAIIHRDLKPSNILVIDVDGRAAPKIIDFGVAKALTQKLTADTMFTHVGALLGTPQYMSPEQADSSGEDIDTRTDVYSLGIILYELLAGAPPLDMRSIAFEEFLRRLREEEPAKPSTKIRTQDAAASTALAHKRQTEPLALAREIRGDLDSITLKALEKDRSRRYGSPSDLAADIGRHLNNEAVLAVPPSAAYHARKFARRYRGPLATACAFALVLILAAIVSVRQSIRANREAAAAQAVNDFLQNDLLAQASASNQSKPSTKPDPDLKVRTALDRAAGRIAGKFDRQPEVEAAIRDTIGRTYEDLGLYPEARTQLERALDLERRALGAENPKTLESMRTLGRVAGLQGKYPEAEAVLSQNLDISRHVLGSEHRDTLSARDALATIYQWRGKYPQAEALNSQTLEIRRRVLGPEHPETLASMSDLAATYYEQGKYAQAETLNSQTLEIRRRILGPEHPDTLTSMNNLTNVYYQQGKYAQAEANNSQILEIRRRVLGSEHRDTIASMNNLADDYTMLGKYVQAEALFGQTLEIERRVFGFDHPDTLKYMSNLAEVYDDEGKYAQAEALLNQTLEMQRRVLGAEHPRTLASMRDLAYTYSSGGKYALAEALFRQALEIRRRVLGPEHPDTLYTLTDMASMYQREGKYSLAEAHAAQALAGQRHALGPEHPDPIDSATELALADQSQGKFAEAEPLAREAVEYDRRKRPDDWQRFHAESLLGASVAGQKKYTEAEPWLLEGFRGMVARKDRIAIPDRYHLDRAREWLVQLYDAWGKPGKAAEWKKK